MSSASSVESNTNTSEAASEPPALTTSIAPSTTSSAATTSETSSASASASATSITTAAASSSATTTAAPRTVYIDMTSDNICPWCFIGKRRLERAIAQLDSTRVVPVLRFHPFFLDSTLAKQSVVKMEHYHAKFGAERTKAMLQRMKATGQAEGIAFSYGGKIGSTLQSHRLLKYVERRVGKEGEGEADKWRRVNCMVDILFRSYFEREEDISDIDTLARLAAQLPELQGREKEVREFLEGKEEDANVQNDVINAYRKGIDGVPHFVFDGQYEVSGGEKPETFLQVFKRLGVY